MAVGIMGATVKIGGFIPRAVASTDVQKRQAFKRSVLDYLYKQDRLEKFTPQINQSELEKYVHIHIEEAEACPFERGPFGCPCSCLLYTSGCPLRTDVSGHHNGSLLVRCRPFPG